MDADAVIGATVAVYPLEPYSDAGVQRFIDALGSTDLAVDVGPMATLVTGPADDVFAALRRAYDAVADSGHVVMTVTVSNACPIPAADR
jgi:uncharacterized protein YqgV (UPF0045/DUF77 family)